MAKESQYTDKILAYMQREKRPVTASEIQEAVGMSRQAAYQWVKAHAWRLREVGTGRHSARAYLLREETNSMPSNFKPSGGWQVKPRSQRNRPAGADGTTASMADLMVGTTLTVSSHRLMEGVIVAELVTDRGAVLMVPIGEAATVT